MKFTSCLSLLLVMAMRNGQQNGRPTPVQHVPARDYAADTASHRLRAVAFIKQVHKPVLDAIPFVLEAQPAFPHEMGCLQEVLADCQTYSPTELKAVEAAANRKHAPWTTAEFATAKLVETDSIQAVFSNQHKGWGYFRKHVGQSFNAFAMPIFLRDNTYCLFYSAYHCGGLCAEGKLVLYRKEKGNWIYVKFYCEWES